MTVMGSWQKVDDVLAAIVEDDRVERAEVVLQGQWIQGREIEEEHSLDAHLLITVNTHRHGTLEGISAGGSNPYDVAILKLKMSYSDTWEVNEYEIRESSPWALAELASQALSGVKRAKRRVPDPPPDVTIDDEVPF